MQKKLLSIIMLACALIALCCVTASAQSDYVAQIGEMKYTQLDEAVAAVPTDGTETIVTLLGDCNGDGIVVNEGQNIIIDFGGFTYTVGEENSLVGSAGTVSQAMQLLKGSKVTLKNGVLTSTTAKILVQNYSNLTLENVTLDGTKSDVCKYTLSNNFGSVLVKETTNIFGDDDTVAFDLWYGMFEVYDEGVTVTFDESFKGSVLGNIEYGAARAAEGWTEKTALVIKGGSFDSKFTASCELDIKNANITVCGGTFTEEVIAEHIADGYVLITNEDGTYGVCNHSSGKTELINAVSAECGKAGYSGDKICGDCGTLLEKGAETAALTHSFTKYVSDKNASYSADGSKTAKCDNGCNLKDTVADKGSKLVLGKTSKLTSSQTTSAITLKWNAVKGATGYRIFRKENGKWVKKTDLNNSTSYKVTGTLKASTKYTYAVRAYVVENGKKILAPKYVTIVAALQPKVISSVKVTPSTKYVNLTWSKATGASGYRVFRYNTSSKTWEIVVKATSATKATVKSLSAGTKYTFAVRPYYNTGTQIIWAKTYTSVKTVTKPAVTSKLTATQTANSITLKWNKVTGATGYRVYVYNKGWKAVKTTASNTYTIKNLKGATKYSYAVKAYTKYGGKYYWSDSFAQIKTATVPAKPTGLKATKTTSTVTLTWNKMTGATGYRIFRYNSSKKSWDIVCKETTATKYTIKNLAGSTNYTFAVRAYIKNGSNYVWSSSYTQIKVKTSPYTYYSDISSFVDFGSYMGVKALNKETTYEDDYKIITYVYSQADVLKAINSGKDINNVFNGSKNYDFDGSDYDDYAVYLYYWYPEKEILVVFAESYNGYITISGMMER